MRARSHVFVACMCAYRGLHFGEYIPIVIRAGVFFVFGRAGGLFFFLPAAQAAGAIVTACSGRGGFGGRHKPSTVLLLLGHRRRRRFGIKLALLLLLFLVLFGRRRRLQHEAALAVAVLHQDGGVDGDGGGSDRRGGVHGLGRVVGVLVGVVVVRAMVFLLLRLFLGRDGVAFWRQRGRGVPPVFEREVFGADGVERGNGERAGLG